MTPFRHGEDFGLGRTPVVWERCWTKLCRRADPVTIVHLIQITIMPDSRLSPMPSPPDRTHSSHNKHALNGVSGVTPQDRRPHSSKKVLNVYDYPGTVPHFRHRATDGTSLPGCDEFSQFRGSCPRITTREAARDRVSDFATRSKNPTVRSPLLRRSHGR
jgi:hypothetical protein